MSANEEAPLVTDGEVDVRKRKINRRRPFSTMLINELPLDVVRLRASDLALKSTGDEFKAAILLWCFAWHQPQPGTLPNDDYVLARITNSHPLKWRAIKDMALHGFKLNPESDRWEHPLILAYARREEKEHLRRGRISARTSNNLLRQKDRMRRAYELVKSMGINIDTVEIKPGSTNQGEKA